jgi:cytochrome c
MKSIRVIAAALAAMLPCAPVLAQEALAQKSGCLACHAVEKRVVGPSYKEVAEKYRGDKSGQAKLEKKVKEGGVGVWGQVPMPPNSFVSDADVKALVSWVLSQ